MLKKRKKEQKHASIETEKLRKTLFSPLPGKENPQDIESIEELDFEELHQYPKIEPTIERKKP